MVDSMFQVLTHRHTGEASWASSWALPHGMKEVQRAGMGGGRPTPYIVCLNYENRSTIDVCVMCDVVILVLCPIVFQVGFKILYFNI